MLDFLIQKANAQGFSNETVNTGFSNEGGAAFNNLLQKILDNIVNPIILLLMALAVVYFLYGVFEFIQNAESSEGRQQGYQHMIWGVVGIFIMVSAIGIKNLIGATLGL